MTSRLAVLATTIGFAMGAGAADEPGDWLGRMGEAARSANYQGVLVYRGDEVLETFRLIHRYSDGSERERVVSLTGDVREILKKNDEVTCVLPKDRRLTVARPTPKALFPSLTPDRLRQISRMYTLEEKGTSRIAGRMCRGLSIRPRDHFRYGYEIWADSRTAVPLKVTLLASDDDGRRQRVVEQMFFTEVDFPRQIPDSEFVKDFPADEVREATVNAADAIARAQKQEPLLAQAGADGPSVRVAEAAAPQFSKLPPGYQVVRTEVREMPDHRGEVEHYVLSDGLSTISVFQARPTGAAQDPEALHRLDRMGALNAYSRMVGPMHVTVVGVAPRETVQMIGDNYEAAALPAPPVPPLPR